MSKTKKLNLAIFFLIAIVSSFMFGCKKTVSVKDVFFSLDSGKQIVLFVGESLELDDYITIKPSNASNKKYELVSFDEKVVEIEGNSVVAVAEGTAQVKIVSKDNKLKQDLMSVVVKGSKTKLDAPRNMIFDSENQLLSFDRVTYATSYTLKINNEEIDLGNSNVYSLSSYNKTTVNTLLNIQVKANSPTYTVALEDSEFCEDFKIYQADGVSNVQIKNGILTFDKSFDALKVNVYLGSKLVAENSSATSFDFTELSETYTGVSTSVYVETVVSDEIKANYAEGVRYFNSNKSSVNLNVLDVPIVSASHTTLTWQNVAYAVGYAILIDGEEVAITENNYFDLQTLDDYYDIITTAEEHEVEVDPIINDLVANVGKTVKTNPIKIKRLAESEISFNNHDIKWKNVANASAYLFTLSFGEDVVELTTTLTEYSMLGKASGSYTFTVQAVGGYAEAEGIYYISSRVASKEFTKAEAVTAEIENYILTVSELGDSTCYVEFDRTPEYNTTLTDGQIIDFSDEDYVFPAGEHKITLTRKQGDAVLSEEFTITFTQLENVTNFRIENNVVKFDVGTNNAGATINFETKKGETLIDSVENFETDTYTFNSSNPDAEKLLSAGDYKALIYVLGDGSSTFSVRTAGEEVACASVDFTVLSKPSLTLKSTSESILLLQGEDNATSFDVYLVGEENNVFAANTENGEFEFELNEGSVAYAAQSLGDGSKYLTSVVGETYSFARLITPTLTYNNSSEVFSKEDANEESLVAGFEFAINGEIDDGYDFSLAKHLTEDAEVSLKTLAVQEKDGVQYLNSLTTTLNLTKITNVTTISLNEFNQVVIAPDSHAEEYALELEFVLDSGNQLFKDNGEGKFINEDGTVETTYTYSDNAYVVEIINNDRLLFDEMISGFGVRARFVKPTQEGGDTLINSEYTDVHNLAIQTITNATTFAINENSQLVITSTGHVEQRGLVLVINDSEDLTFKSSGAELINKSEQKIKFVYNAENSQYVINLLDEGYNIVCNELLTNFTVKVKYTLYLDATSSVLDSEFTDAQTVNTLNAATISRNEQYLEITHPQNDYTYNNYGLLINNKELLLLTEEAVAQGEGSVLIKANYIFENATDALEEINTISVVVMNIASTSDYLQISRKGNSVQIKRTQAITLTASKNNAVDENSVVVNFNTYETTYEKYYYVNIYNDSGDLFKTIRVGENIEEVDETGIVKIDENGVVTITLDKIDNLPEVFYIEGYVNCLASEDDVGVFNSPMSNKLEFSKLETVTDLRVSEGILYFTPVDNVVGYEIYQQTGTGYIKLNTGLVSGAEYDLKNITENKIIVVKAISNNKNIINSVFSEPIELKVLSTLEVTAEDGEFLVKLPNEILFILLTGSATVVPEVTNENEELIEINLDAEDADITLEGTSLRIAPQVLLDYEVVSLLPQKLSFIIKLKYETATANGIYYLNSNIVDFVAYPLLAPTKVEKTTNNNETVEFITWTPDPNNTIKGEVVDVGYTFKIERTGDETTETYFSTDSKLLYYTSGIYSQYNAILLDNNTTFPAGYDTDGDGKLDSEEDVVFGVGKYKIYVKTVPCVTIDGYNLFYSMYTQATEFEILGETEVIIEDGNATWNAQEKASKYRVEIFKDGETKAWVTDYVTISVYDFTNPTLDKFSGVLKVVVTAISNRTDVLCGQASKPIFVYRLPEATNVHLDDGQLIVTANKYFSTALVEFTDVTTGKTYIESYSNSSATVNLTNLGIETWQGFKDDDRINEPFKFAIALDGDVLTVLDGRHYTINVKLVGNTNRDKENEWGTISSSKAQNIAYLRTTKMNPVNSSVTLGEISFEPHANYATITQADDVITYTNLVDLNYVFNGGSYLETDFWNNTAVYKIQINRADDLVLIYAVDYYSFMSAIRLGLINSKEYEILERANGLYAVVKYYVSATEAIYFNVYKENTLNIREFDEISYYQTQETIIEGENILTSDITEKNFNLAEGGSFVVTITMMGGDSRNLEGNNEGQLNSGKNKLRTFLRYGINELSTANGQLKLNDMVFMEGETVLDSPVYKLVITPFNTTDDRVFYLYTTSEDNAKDVAKVHDLENYESAVYVKLEKDETEGFLYFDLSTYLDAGNYKASVRTLAGTGNEEEDYDDYLLNSKVPQISYTFYKLADVEFSTASGVLTFQPSYIARDTEIIYCKNYEVTLYDDTNTPYVYEINIDDAENVEWDKVNNIVYYTVPSHLTYDDVVVPIEANREYKIKIRAMSEDNYILNGTYAKDLENDILLTFTKSQGIENLRVEDGMLKWQVIDENTNSTTVIKIVFLDQNLQIIVLYVSVNNENANNQVVVDGEYQYHFYEFTNEKYSGYYLESGVDFTISAYVSGKGNVLNSNYCTEISTYRLATVNAASIKTLDGVLTWDVVEGAQYYEISINGNKFTSLTNNYDVSNEEFEVGNYFVNVKAIGTNRITGAFLRNNVENFIQLGEVDTSTVVVSGETITWAAVEHAQGYTIEFNYNDLDGNPQSVTETVTTNQFVILTEGMRGKFTMLITAVGVGESKVFNGKTVEYTSSSDAPIQVANFEFDNVNNRFVIDVNNVDFLSSDSLAIVYNYEEYVSQLDTKVATRKTETINFKQVGMYEVVDETITRYYLPITVMAKYTNIYVQVDRPNTLSSNKVQIEDIDYHLFSYGAGTEENAYRIYTAEQLLNITYFPAANYVLTSSLNLTGVDIAERVSTYGGIIAEEFNGVLDGNNFAILGFNIDDQTGKDIITLNDQTGFALFEKLNNATIKNLTIGKEDVQMILSNTFANATNDMIKLSLIATTASASTVDNLKVVDYRVEFNQDDALTKRFGGVYVGGLFNEITDTTIKNSHIKFSTNVNANVSSDVNVYLAGISSNAINSQVNNTQVNMTVETKTRNILSYVGGMFAYYVGNEEKTKGISGSSVEFNMTNVQALYVGGLAGYAELINIEASETTGSYTKSYISYNAYVGGLVGHAQSSTIQNSGSNMNLNLSVSNTNNKFFGAIVGRLSVNNDISAEMINCYSSVYVEGQEETTVSTTQVVIGMFGSATGASVQGSKNEK